MDIVITQEEKERLREIFQEVPQGTKILFFTQSVNCPTCPSMDRLAQAISEASDGKIKVETYNFVQDKDKVEKFKVDKVPAFVFTDENETDYGIVFYGLPIGYEFITLVETLKMIASKSHGLSPRTLQFLNELDKNLDIMVFVTPTCPYCPQAAILVYKLAMASDKVRSQVIEAMEFEELSMKYNVFGVPKIVINDKIEIEGAMPEAYFIEHVKRELKRL